jgi:AAA domain
MHAANRVDVQAVQFKPITAAELDGTNYVLDYLIKEVLVEMQPLIAAGAKKTLKTNIFMDLAISVATGSSFLGKFRVNRPCRVALMSGESGLATLQETARRICRSRGIKLGDVSELIVSPDLPKLADAAHLRALEDFIVGNSIKVLVADPAYLMLPGDDAGNLFKQGALLREVSELCRECGTTLALLHHTKKNVDDAFRPAELEDISWAGFSEFARQWLLLSRRKRYEPGTGRHELWLNIGGSAGHSSCWALNIDEGRPDDPGGRRWGVEIVTPDQARQEAANQSARAKAAGKDRSSMANVDGAKKAIIDTLRKVDGGATTVSTIKEGARMKGAAFDAALASLVKEEKIEKCEVQRANKQMYPGYRYVPDLALPA